ncbi:MAG: TIGR01212 family radical SAM protein [Roseburia sp.]|nr:TIGR01212 family radical SAM protein [Roseburia sp.]MCM1279861.1 TIGR01212 family radical SAM protein [Robinsoniella sp.]
MKPYYTLSDYLKNTYGEKIYKIALDGGFTCPNRDGTLAAGGCIFCSKGGSGEFAVPAQGLSIDQQITAGLSLFHGKKTGNRFIAYFQAYTNTYGPIAKLEKLYREALLHPRIVGISIATRPDCLGDEVLSLFSMLKKEFPQKFIWVELGLQTVSEKTAAYIKRGYSLPICTEAIRKLHALSIPVIVHLILGLPGETMEHVWSSIDYVNRQAVFGVKLQLLHILKDTKLAEEYRLGNISPLSKEEYLQILTSAITHLSPEITIHRVTGDGSRELLLAPLWSLNKRDVLNSLHKKMKLEHAYQGKEFSI